LSLSKGQSKISSFFSKQNGFQNQQRQSVLSEKGNTNRPISPEKVWKQSSPEIILDKLSPTKEFIVDKNYDLSSTPKQDLSTKRKLSCGEESPDIIPSTPTSKNIRSIISVKRAKVRASKGTKLENSFSEREGKQSLSFFEGVANNASDNGCKSLQTNCELQLVQNSPCIKNKRSEIENIYPLKRKSENLSAIHIRDKVVNNKNIKKIISHEENIQFNFGEDCIKLDLDKKSFEDSVEIQMKNEFENTSSNNCAISICSDHDKEESIREQQNEFTSDSAGLQLHMAHSPGAKIDRPVELLKHNVFSPCSHRIIDSGCSTCQGDVKQCGSLESNQLKITKGQRPLIESISKISDELIQSCSLPETNKHLLASENTTDVDNAKSSTDNSVSLSKQCYGCDVSFNEIEDSMICSDEPPQMRITSGNIAYNSNDANINAKDSVHGVTNVHQYGKPDINTTAATTEHCTEAQSFSDTGRPAEWLSLDGWDFSSLEDKEIGADSSLEVSDIVSIKACRSEATHDVPWFISNSTGLLVHHPDTLISSTAVVGSLFCPRRGVLSEWFRGIDGDSKIMVIGSLIHELLQEVLEKKLSTVSAIESLVREIVSRQNCIQLLYSARMSQDEALKELESFVPRISNFVAVYVQEGGPKLIPPAKCDKNKATAGTENFDGIITAIQDIEENIWAPKLGLKGKVDVTVEVKVNRQQRNITKNMPLELKTGRSSFSAEHKGQVTLYTMMMSQFGNEVDAGLLLYLRDGIMQEVKAGNNEWRDLIILRNQLAHFITRLPLMTDDSIRFKPPQLPEPINHHSACGNCPYLTICTSFLKCDGLPNLSPKNPLTTYATTATAHLSPSHIDYLIHWTGLILLEESQNSGPFHQKDLWCLNTAQREKRGKCLSSLSVVEKVVENGSSFVHILQKKNSQSLDLRSSGLTVGEYVTVSTDERVAIATGTISDITLQTLTLLLNRDVTKCSPNSYFHVDIYTMQTGKVFNLTNLGCLMDQTDAAGRLRRLIIDKECPTFIERLSSNKISPAKSVLVPLNMGQRRAVVKALTANDYLLIKGMPGTGKTATIVSLVELLVKLGQSVLVTSHTHSAVDNVLLKLAARGLDLLRIGSSSRIHPQLRAKSEGELTANCTSPAQMEAVYDSKPVVGTTCLGAGHPLFTRRTFDICIVDESTQVLQISVLRPLFSAKKFILVGDPEQLPPVIKNKKARSLGMSESLFARLDFSDATVCLDLQYRMNQAITDVANSLTYKGLLKCGNEKVSNATLQLPTLHMITEELKSMPWLHSVVSSALHDSVVVLDTGPVWKKQAGLDENHAVMKNESEYISDMNSGKSSEENVCTNIYEATIVQRVIQILMKVKYGAVYSMWYTWLSSPYGGVTGSSIGVIAPYRAQVALLRKMVPSDGDSGVEVNTVDQYQGRDKDVIIFSCTRTEDIGSSEKSHSNRNKESEILGDKRRLTVAITRAKYKLLIVGDVITLQNYQPFKDLCDCLPSDKIISLCDSMSTD
ncbi:hypothetical protein ANN_24162, partial [Periplaneta americana]